MNFSEKTKRLRQLTESSNCFKVYYPRNFFLEGNFAYILVNPDTQEPTDFYISIDLKLREVSWCKYKVFDLGEKVSLEEILPKLPESIQDKLLFDLDLFSKL